jgi:hypothetical protein
VRLLASGEEVPRACAQADLRLPPAGLDGLGYLLQAEWEKAPELGRIAVGPGAFDAGAAGRGVAGLRDAALPASLARRVC